MVAALSAERSRCFVICLTGTFRRPIRVWGKYSNSLLTITAAPGRPARLRLGAVRPHDVPRFVPPGGDAGGVSILVEVRHDVGHTSACFLHGDHDCSGIYLLDNTVSQIANRAGSMARSKRYCGNSGVGAYGIAGLSYGQGAAGALQHVVIEGNAVDHTRTGQSETATGRGTPPISSLPPTASTTPTTSASTPSAGRQGRARLSPPAVARRALINRSGCCDLVRDRPPVAVQVCRRSIVELGDELAEGPGARG